MSPITIDTTFVSFPTIFLFLFADLSPDAILNGPIYKEQWFNDH